MYGSEQKRTSEGFSVSHYAASRASKSNFRTHRRQSISENGEIYGSAAGSVIAAFSGTIVECSLPVEDISDFH